MLLPEARQRHVRPARQAHPDQGEGRATSRTISTSTTSEGLLACVQMGTIEFHGWGSKVDKVEYPDRLVFDLDPDVGLDFANVEGRRGAAARAARRPRPQELPAADRRQGHPRRRAARRVEGLGRRSRASPSASAAPIAEAEPETFTANIRKAQRKGRIFLDWLRNQRGATAVMPYSARAREGAPVAAPIAWDELDQYRERPPFQHPRRGRIARRARVEVACRLGQGEASLAGCIEHLAAALLPLLFLLTAAAPPDLGAVEGRGCARDDHPRRLGHRPRPRADRRRRRVRDDLRPGRRRLPAHRGQLSDRARPHRRGRGREGDLAGFARAALRQRRRAQGGLRATARPRCRS